MMPSPLKFEFLYPAFQPLISLADGFPFGYEALLRCSAGTTPDVLFHNARQSRQLYALDTFAAYEAIQHFSCHLLTTPSQAHLFVNVFPSTICHPEFSSFLEQAVTSGGIDNNRIVLEINETNEEDKMWEVRTLGDTLEGLRAAGFRIALDDVGKGAASLTKIIEYEPDFLKLDRYFCTGLSSNVNKQRLVSLFVQYCCGNTALVLEGIEHEEDLEMARSLGVPIGQGFFLGMPQLISSP